MDADVQRRLEWSGGETEIGASPALVPPAVGEKFGDTTPPQGDLPLDYYLIFTEAGDWERGVQPGGIVIEEFVLRDDYTAAGLDSTGWTPASGTWWSSSAFSRDIRVDPTLRNRVLPVSRRDVEIGYDGLGGGQLPNDAILRTYFHDRQPLPASATLPLRPEQAPPGFGEKRVYRILFAKELDERGLANVWSVWQLEPVDDPADPQARVVGRARLTVADHTFMWDLRRVGPGVAWSVDVTAYLGDGSASAVGALLQNLKLLMREQGLIPITIERFA
jgi:hypothetical protein